MPTTLQSPLERNLESLGSAHDELVARLRRTAPRPGLAFEDDAQGLAVASLDGRALCSRRRPLDEARRLADGVDLVEHAVVVVMGFGLGHHVRELARRLDRTGVIVVFEPDVELLRAVLERVDHADWLTEALVVFVTDPDDRATLANRLAGAESIVAQGVHFLEHPSSRTRLGEAAARFSTLFGDFVTAARTTLLTTLVRSTETVRNLLLNIDHYAGGPGIADLAGAARGHPAVVVSAGPSLHRQIERLADPAVRERCVIIAVQTTLKPLLEAGVRPHFVTALDYHEISRRFYEGLDAHDLRDVTLVAEPKAHPIILDLFPGPRRCCASPFLDRILGDTARDMGGLRAGATVAHLALYLARHLGCSPTILVGQDLGFTDGLYYAPGTAIDDVWAPELNPFNTIEMMQWQRIVRHRLHLHRMSGPDGRDVFTDAQMLAYLQQFERDFAAFAKEGMTIIDATEGGVAKQHVETMSLADALARCPRAPLPSLPAAPPDRDDLGAVRARVAAVRHDVLALRRVSERTRTLLATMQRDQADAARMDRHFRKLEKLRAEVSERMETFELVNQLNQLGVYKRQRADRRLHLAQDLDDLARQRAQLERDETNVTWLVDAAAELLEQLDASQRVLAGEAVMPPSSRPAARGDDGRAVRSRTVRVAALVPVDPQRGGLGGSRSLDARFGDGTVLHATLARLGRCRELDELVVLAPRGLDVDALVDRAGIGRPVEVERVDVATLRADRDAGAAARAWAATSWRGGIGGACGGDEALVPRVMSEVARRRGLDAVLAVGPDWPLVDPASCDAVVARHREHPEQNRLVFTQAPPGLCGALASTALLEELAAGNRRCSFGALLVYQPHAPQADPVAKAANVQVPAAVRGAMLRAVADDERARSWMQRAAAELGPDAGIEAIAKHLVETLSDAAPSRPAEVRLELTARRARRGRFHRSRGAAADRDMPLAGAEAIIAELAGGETALTLDGVGDPLLHPGAMDILDAARRAGVRHVHVRTELRGDADEVRALVAMRPAVISVDLHADRAATYAEMMGDDGFRAVLENIELAVETRGGAAALALPWIVPRLQRCSATIDDIETFYDRWQHRLGAAVIEAPPEGSATDAVPGGRALLAARTPRAAVRHQLRRRMTILADGAVPVDECDRGGAGAIGRAGEEPIETLWARVRAGRSGPDATEHRLWAP